MLDLNVRLKNSLPGRLQVPDLMIKRKRVSECLERQKEKEVMMLMMLSSVEYSAAVMATLILDESSTDFGSRDAAPRLT